MVIKVFFGGLLASLWLAALARPLMLDTAAILLLCLLTLVGGRVQGRKASGMFPATPDMTKLAGAPCRHASPHMC